MEVAVTAVLADVPSQLTARDVFGDWRILLGFKPSRRNVSQAAGGPHSAGILAAAGGVDAPFNGGKPCQLGTGTCSRTSNL